MSTILQMPSTILLTVPKSNVSVRGPWQAGGLFTGSRGMLLSGLTPGTTYCVHVRAVGGSTNYSDWSDPVSHMCM